MVTIKSFIPISFSDWDGKVSAVIFLSGCNFKCPFCYNKDLVFNSKDLKEISPETVKDYLKNNADFVDGLVITGGEPTVFSDLPDLCREIKKTGIAIKLDTNGSNPEMLQQLIKEKLIDYVAMDIKLPLNRYGEVTEIKGIEQKIRQSLEIIKNFNYELRTTVVPGMHTGDDMLKLARDLEKIGVNKKFFLQQFKPLTTLDPKLEQVRPYSQNELEEMKQQIAPYFKKIGLRI